MICYPHNFLKPHFFPGFDNNSSADVFLRDLQTSSTFFITIGSTGQVANSDSELFLNSMSSDGRFVTFASHATNLVAGLNDTNGKMDVFVFDRQLNARRRVSESTAGVQANGDSNVAVISPDGRFIAFGSVATNLVAGDTNGLQDCFVHDLVTGATERVSLSSAAAQITGDSGAFQLSGQGQHVMFMSDAPNAVPGDTNLSIDVFVRTLPAR